MNAMNYYLSRRILLLSKTEPGAPIPLEGLGNEVAASSGFGKLFELLGDDKHEIDPAKVDHELHTATRILLDDEKVLMAFKAGRDVTLFTNLRIMEIDVQGIFGAKIEYSSMPYKSIRAWAVETAGVWDTDTELALYTRNRWTAAKIKCDFRTGKCDIQQINRFLSALIIGKPTDSKVDMYQKNYASGTREANPIEFKSFGMFNNCWQIDASEMDSKLRSDPAILLDEETTLKAFQSGRDVTVYTDRRLIVLDVKGVSGKRVKYKSIPFKNIFGFEFETHGNLDNDAEIYQYTNIANVESASEPRHVPYLRVKQSLLVKDIDIYEIGKIFLDHTLMVKQIEPSENGIETETKEEEPEIDLSSWGF